MMKRKYDMNGRPILFPREREIERLIRRIRNSGILFDEDYKRADKAFELLGRAKSRLSSYNRSYTDSMNEDALPSWLTKADLM